MIIKDVEGGKLSLTSTTLREVTGAEVPGDKWSLELKDLKEAFPEVQRPVLHRTHEKYGEMVGYIIYDPRKYRIGCRIFDQETFALIRKAIKEVVKK